MNKRSEFAAAAAWWVTLSGYCGLFVFNATGLKQDRFRFDAV
ncbi:hypothetical protein [Paenibacillus typhae]|nr:hypothetical protein [Paenibacillus typhae]